MKDNGIDSLREQITSLTAERDAAIQRAERAEASFRCYHCGKVCTTKEEADEHFGIEENATPLCVATSEAHAAAVEAAFKEGWAEAEFDCDAEAHPAQAHDEWLNSQARKALAGGQEGEHNER